MNTLYHIPDIQKIECSNEVREMILKWDKQLLRTKHIEFNRYYQDPSKKTMDIDVNNSKGLRLGEIKWYAPWRKYIFEPRSNLQMIYDDQCLHVIGNFIQMLMILHKLSS
jgi:hypothetical protein